MVVRLPKDKLGQDFFFLVRFPVIPQLAAVYCTAGVVTGRRSGIKSFESLVIYNPLLVIRVSKALIRFSGTSCSTGREPRNAHQLSADTHQVRARWLTYEDNINANVESSVQVWGGLNWPLWQRCEPPGLMNAGQLTAWVLSAHQRELCSMRSCLWQHTQNNELNRSSAL